MTPLASPQVYVEELSTLGALSAPTVDMVMYVLLIALIICILWLSNRHIRSSHSRMDASDKFIDSERASFERRISERTTALMRAEEQRLIELQRNAEFGKLSQGLFHDLISPLSAVSLYAQELSAHTQYSEKTKEAIRVVTESSRRMNSYMESVKRSLSSDAGQASTGYRVEAELHKEISIVTDILGYKARMAGVEIVVNQPTEKILLPIHPVRLHQLLINLVSNAIDACIAQTAASGETPGKDREHKVTISALKNGSHIELSVADTGCGISAEHQARLFKDQFTTKNGGSGIGLMTIKSVVNGDLGGTIEVKSKEGKGAEFVVRI